jgi:hypothetical protein
VRTNWALLDHECPTAFAGGEGSIVDEVILIKAEDFLASTLQLVELCANEVSLEECDDADFNVGMVHEGSGSWYE